MFDKNQKRICLVANLDTFLLNFHKDLIQDLIDKGHEVHIVSGNCDQLTQGVLSKMGCLCHFLKFSRSGKNIFSEFLLELRFYLLFKKIKPASVVSFTIKPIVHASTAAHWAGVPQIASTITGLGYAFLGKGFLRKIFQSFAEFLYRRALSKNQIVFFLNKADRDLFVNKKIINLSKCSMFVIPGTGINTQYFSVVRPSVGETVNFIYIGRLIADKGLNEFVVAAEMIKRLNLPAQFFVLGPEDVNPSAIPISKILSYQDKGVLNYLGVSKDVREELSRSHVLVLPSYREGMPRTILEAMSCGLAVLATDVPGCQEAVVHGKTGFLVEARNASALAEAMEKFIREPALVQEYGNEGRKYAEDIFEVSKVNQKILQALNL